MEVFDTKSKTWEFLQIPSEEICKGSKYRSISYQGTVYVRSEEKKVTYKVHKGKWREADICMNKRWGCSGSSYCVIEDVFYCYCDRKICWYDLKERIWKPLKCCLEGLPRLACDINRFCLLADHGGRLAILWQEYVCETKIIWCAEIALERRQNLEIWGKIEWHGNVVSIPTRLGGVHALTSTVW
uniref:FKB95-like N-terminal Kelch domain-containing protein n=2 Tax=Brassica oleracea var. oleracea TaxID=109376 RepID=A0A0D3BRR0_BRAOL